MSIKKLHLLDEGSWALMIEESNVRALQRYHGSMAQLDIQYYLSIGTSRYYKGYFEEEGLARIREGIVRFLLNDDQYFRCVSAIHDVLELLQGSDDSFAKRGVLEQFELYCSLLCDYIAYYNSVITDTFYVNVFDIVDAELSDDLRIAAKAIKDALFATNNNELLTHMQTVDMLAISERYLEGRDVDEDIEAFVRKYQSTTISSASPDGITAAEVQNQLSRQTTNGVQAEKAFLDNLHFRYINAERWSERTASSLQMPDRTKRLIRRAAELSLIKIQMREAFQEFKITARSRFLSALIQNIGKREFDYMRIDEIADFIRLGTRVHAGELARRQEMVVFELNGDRIDFLDELPRGASIETRRDSAGQALSGDVLIGSGTKTYRVKKVTQHEEGLTSFDHFIDATQDREDVAVITNVLRPYLVPKLRKFGALLTQYGGYTSHASVLCRELGINSMISVEGLLDAFDTDDLIDVDFDRGTVRRLDDASTLKSDVTEAVVDLLGEQVYAPEQVGAKAANLMRIARSTRIAEGFVVPSQALRSIGDKHVQEAVLGKVASMNCDRVVVRSSHASEDGSLGSYAGLFESYIDVDARDSEKIIDLARSVYRSQEADGVSQYGPADGDMSVIVQEMISADISGVVLTSNPFRGYDYMLFEYVLGDLCYLMQGDITPLRSYIRKADIIENRETYGAYPVVIAETYEGLFRSLAKIAIELETQFSHRLQIEWGIRDAAIYIFQARSY